MGVMTFQLTCACVIKMSRFLGDAKYQNKNDQQVAIKQPSLNRQLPINLEEVAAVVHNTE